MGKMTRKKWKSLCLSFVVLLYVEVQCHPIRERAKIELENLETETILPNEIVTSKTENVLEIENNYNNETIAASHEAISHTSDLRPGQLVSSYAVDIKVDGNTFEGRAIITVELAGENRDDTIRFYVEDLDIHSIEFGQLDLQNAQPINDFEVDSGILEIDPPISSWMFVFAIEYSGIVRDDGYGIYRRHYDDDQSYLAMNLHPTHARRVFPCLDEPTEAALISFNFNNEEHNNIVANSINEGDEDEAEFEALQSPPYLWGIVAHNFISVNVMGDRLRLSGRVHNQGGYAQTMMQEIFIFLNEWTEKDFVEIDENQDGMLHVFAMPDITRDWYALSTIAIWEPYVLMKDQHSVKQQVGALKALTEGFSRQWFGYVIYPQNWKYAWVTEGLGSYAAYKAAETDTNLDMKSIFLTDVIHESMMRDSFPDSQVLEPEDYMFDEQEIRDHLNGILRYKAPALFQMLNLVLGEETDYIKTSARNLISSRALQQVNDFHFYDSLNSMLFFDDDAILDDVVEFLEPWIHNTGYPVINVSVRSGGLFITQIRFGFTPRDSVLYDIPLTYTTSKDPDFDDIYPEQIMGQTEMLDVDLDDEDWIIFNIQGQGYYRVNYAEELWDNIIDVLEDEEERDDIHVLNRASLLDDALNLARAGQLDYDIALRMTLTMELEKEYAPWKTFVRNMNFLKKQLLAYVAEDDDLDPDIYLRMVRRTIETFEEEIGFEPERLTDDDYMVTYTRGIVMDHACRAEYEDCVLAAYEWFLDDDGKLNEDIPPEIRPAVYCTMVRDDDEEDEKYVEILSEHFKEEESLYERVVILESFACSHNKDFIIDLLEETLDEDGRFGVEERALFFEAVAESNVENARIALQFIRSNTDHIRDMYGGPDRLERIIHTLADNLVTEDLVEMFETWVDGINSSLEDSRDSARRALDKAQENLLWRKRYLEDVYEWIDENGSSTVTVSLLMFAIITIVHMFTDYLF